METTAEHVAVKVRTFSTDEWDAICVDQARLGSIIQAFITDLANQSRLSAHQHWAAACGEDEQGTVSLYLVALHEGEETGECDGN